MLNFLKKLFSVFKKKEEVEIQVNIPDKIEPEPVKVEEPVEPKVTYKPIKIVLDPGHGGMIDGNYQTAGKRSPKWSDGRQLFEGVSTREIVNKAVEQLKDLGIDAMNLVPEQEDMSLAKRTARLNLIDKNALLISVHHNAGRGTGFEAFAYKEGTESHKLATEFYKTFKEVFPLEKLRYGDDGKLAKVANFQMLRQPEQKAALLEFFFMDNEKDCQILLDPKGQDLIVKVIVETIKRVLKD